MIQMAKTAHVLGDSNWYRVNPKIKVYSLIDRGFQTSPKGNFLLQQPISGNSPYLASYQLKIRIQQDLQNLRMDTTDEHGLQIINIFKLKDKEQVIEQYNFAIADLVEREILELVKK